MDAHADDDERDAEEEGHAPPSRRPIEPGADSNDRSTLLTPAEQVMRACFDPEVPSYGAYFEVYAERRHNACQEYRDPVARIAEHFAAIPDP